MATVSSSALPNSPPVSARGTQSFVHILGDCWRRPSLLALELAWRWLFGLPLLALLGWAGWRIWEESAAQLRATGVLQFSLLDPMTGALQVAAAWGILEPRIVHLAEWLVPLSLLAWAVASGLGRNAVVRRYDRRLSWRPGAMILLQLLRIAALCGTFAVWFLSIQWAAHLSLAGASASSAAGGEPNLVLYCALVIVFSLGIFTLWALLSWVFSIAPLLAVLEGRGVGGSLVRSLRLGRLTGKLVEINLVMGIVKLALIVLAMVFTATPLPFQAEVQGNALYAWWAGVTLLYLIASDFFQVARVVAYIELWGVAVQAGTPSAQAVFPDAAHSLHRC